MLLVNRPSGFTKHFRSSKWWSEGIQQGLTWVLAVPRPRGQAGRQNLEATLPRPHRRGANMITFAGASQPESICFLLDLRGEPLAHREDDNTHSAWGGGTTRVLTSASSAGSHAVIRGV